MAIKGRTRDLTTPDLVLLSLLAERPMHGYEANQELERRQVRDWAGISRPQVYYSLEKLAKQGLLEPAESDEPASGPERRVLRTSERGRESLAEALEKEEWAIQLDRPPFSTWLALSWQAGPGVAEMQLQRRREFLESQIGSQKQMLEGIVAEVGHSQHEAVWMVKLNIEKLEAEQRWVRMVTSELKSRAPAKG
jgi:DNA-binding PadR family transcriptional regulator